MPTPMDEAFEVLDSANALAGDMLAVVHDELLVNYRFMNRSIANLPVRVRMDVRTCCTDGRQLSFSPGFVLNSFESMRPLLARSYAHMILHCLLRHPFPPPDVDKMRWTCACDAAVSALLQQLDGPAIHVEDDERDAELARILERAGSRQPTAHALYAQFEHEGLSDEELARLDLLFGMDAHDSWWNDDVSGVDVSQADESALEQLREQWEQIARQTEMDLAAEQAGAHDDALSLALSGVDADPMGLDELLRQFAAPSEVIQVNPDEFDYVYYTYGLATYGNIPLVEPLEYCESPHIRDFVVAIDTSGSVDERLVRLFVSRACGMLLADNALDAESRVRVMQCDMRVQDERLLVSTRDVEAYLDGLELLGRGGTDLRPVFDRIDELIDDGSIADMSGLVYFTDGMGEVPVHAPTYDTAFVFVDKLGPSPSWATSVLTYSDELMGS